mmetsp:Transcript_118603/g.335495  ORF Transcript_118603/g.335495 Transcript_118603/m.335495 type:complete len:212 (+) Transcript_118603:178-813(+)
MPREPGPGSLRADQTTSNDDPKSARRALSTPVASSQSSVTQFLHVPCRSDEVPPCTMAPQCIASTRSPTARANCCVSASAKPCHIGGRHVSPLLIGADELPVALPANVTRLVMPRTATAAGTKDNLWRLTSSLASGDASGACASVAPHAGATYLTWTLFMASSSVEPAGMLRRASPSPASRNRRRSQTKRHWASGSQAHTLANSRSKASNR